MQISLRLGAHGWSDLDLWLDDKHQSFCITHVFNHPLVDIADAMLSLHRGAAEASFTLHEEPGQHVWTMSQIQKEQHLLLVEIRSYEENFRLSRSEFEVTEFRVCRDFFVGSFLMEFEKIAYQLRSPQFAQDRRTDQFSWDTWKELRRGKTQSDKRQQKA